MPSLWQEDHRLARAWGLRDLKMKSMKGGHYIEENMVRRWSYRANSGKAPNFEEERLADLLTE